MPQPVCFLVVYETHDNPEPPDGLAKCLASALRQDCGQMGLTPISYEPMTTRYSVADQGRFRSQRIAMVQADEAWAYWFDDEAVIRSLSGWRQCYAPCCAAFLGMSGG